MINYFKLLASEGKRDETLRTHLRRRNVWNVICKNEQMIDERIFPYTFRHRYAKASQDAAIARTNIKAAKDHTREVHLKVMQDSF